MLVYYTHTQTARTPQLNRLRMRTRFAAVNIFVLVRSDVIGVRVLTGT